MIYSRLYVDISAEFDDCLFFIIFVRSILIILYLLSYCLYDFDNLSVNDIEELIKLKIQKEKEKLISEWVDEGIKVEKGRWGRSIISSGKKKVEIPKEIDPKTITLDIAKQYLNPKKKK